MTRNKFALLGIVLLGLLLRFFILSQRGSLWFDEAFSVHFAAMDLGQMWSYLKFENNPPLYFVLLHFWMKLFGTSELVVRVLSMIFGIAAIPLVYVLGKKLHSSTAGLFGALVFALSPLQAVYSTIVRMYPLLVFLTLFFVWLFLKKQERRSLILHSSFFIVLLLLAWTHITAWLIVAALLVYLLWQEKFNLKKFFILNSSFFIAIALVVLSLLPWLVNFVHLKIASPLSQGWFFYLPPPRNYFLDMLEGFLVFGENNAFIVTLLSVVIVVLLWFAIHQSKAELLATKEHKAQLLSIRLLLCWLFIPLLIGLAFQSGVPRYFIAVAPAFYVLLGIGFARLSMGRMTKFAVVFLFAALMLASYPSVIKIAHYEWDKVAGWIEVQETRNKKQETNSLILINPHSEILPFERYYRGNLKVVGFYPREDNWDRDMRIVRTNWISLNTKENVPRLRDVTAGYDTVFLVTGGLEPVGRNLVPIWFWENGWRRVDFVPFRRFSVTLLERVP